MTQKHAIWFVPSYDNRGSATNPHPCSYLRIGSMTSSVDELSSEELRGDDLLAEAGITASTTEWFKDDSAAQNDGVDRNQSGAESSYYRYDGNPETSSEPADLTGELMTRGGWRDHTDGNRISTTRGDRLDFVQGNYKRVIFGRVTNVVPGVYCHSCWDSTGGHNHEATSTPGEVTAITWVSDQDGTWKTIERTDKGNVCTRFSGELEEHVDGGSELHTWTGVSGGDDDQNPVIDEQTYAKTITSSTTCTSMDSKVYATNTTSKTYVHGDLTSTTNADSINDFSLCGIANSNTNTVVHEQNTTFSTRHEFTVVHTTVSLNLVGWDFTQRGVRLVPYPFEDPPAFKPAGAMGVFLGAKAEMFVGGVVSAEIGIFKMILRMGTVVEALFGTKTTLKLMGVYGGTLDDQIAVLDKEIKLLDVQIETLGTEIAALEQKA